jgi:hypothetical protein
MRVDDTPEAGIEMRPAHAAADASVSEPAESPKRKPSLGSGYLRVGALDPRAVKVLTVLGFAVPVVAYIAFLQHYQVNALWQDQWDDVPVIRQSFLHFPDWSSLWIQHVDNRIFFPNLIVLALAHTLSYNITVEEYIGALLLFAATALFIWSHKRRSPHTPLLFYCPVAFLTLTFAQWQNTIWGFQMAWYLVVFALALTIALLDRPRFGWPIFVAAVLVAVVGSFSSLQGLLIWLVGLVILYHRRRAPSTFIAWIVAAGLTTILYFHNFVSSAAFNPSKTVLNHPYFAVKFFIFSLGDVVGLQEQQPKQGNGWVMAFGVVIFVLAVLVVFRWGLRRDEYSGAPIGIAMILFGLLFDALITQGRLFIGYFAASQSRYTTNDVLVLAGIYLTVLSGAPFRVPRKSEGRIAGAAWKSWRAVAWIWSNVERLDRFPLRGVVLVAIVIQIVFSLHFAFGGARVLHQHEVTAASVTRNIKDEPPGKVVSDLYFVQSDGWIREQTQFLQEHHLSLFG